MEATKIHIATTVSASPSKVWTSWTEPEHIINWNFAHESWQCPWAKNDMQVGGKYIARMEAKDGSFGFDFEAIYDEIVHEQKMAYTLTDGRKVVTYFEKEGNITKISTTFEAESSNPLEMQQNGWQAILDNFKKYTESLN